MGGILVELGGKTRTLRFDFNAIADLEDAAGMGITAMLSTSRIGVSTIRLFFWAALRHEEPTLTRQAVGEMVQAYLDAGNELETLVDRITEAIKASGLKNL